MRGTRACSQLVSRAQVVPVDSETLEVMFLSKSESACFLGEEGKVGFSFGAWLSSLTRDSRLSEKVVSVVL